MKAIRTVLIGSVGAILAYAIAGFAAVAYWAKVLR